MVARGNDIQFAQPNPENIIEAKLSTCTNCGMPIAEMMGMAWLHAHSNSIECEDPRLDPPES